jgi:hypothetical protein
MGFIFTLGAGFVVVETDTGKQGDRPVQKSNYAGKRDVFGFFDEVVTAAFAFFAAEVSGLSEFEEDIFEKLMRNAMLFSDIVNQDSFIFPMLTEVGKGMQGILGLFG